jgi:integrase/recombinase XerD
MKLLKPHLKIKHFQPSQLNKLSKAFAEKLIADQLSINNAGNAIIPDSDKQALAHANNLKLTFMEIDYNFLEGFKHQLTKAIKAKLVERSHYPFF